MAEKLMYLGFCSGNACKSIKIIGYVTVITPGNELRIGESSEFVKPWLQTIVLANKASVI